MWPFKRKTLQDHLDACKKISVLGMTFKIKKVDPSNFLDGSKVMLQYYELYKIEQKGSAEDSLRGLQKVKDHYKDVFMASVVEPKLKRKQEDEGLLVDNLFTDWTLCHELYSQIMFYTHGKKK